MIFIFKRVFNKDKQIEFEYDSYDSWTYYSLKNNMCHSYNDKPAVVDYYGRLIKNWFKEGLIHRLNGPAKIDGNISYYFIENNLIPTKEEFEKRVKGIIQNGILL